MIVVLIFGRRVMVKSVCCDSNVKCPDVRERNEADQFCRGISSILCHVHFEMLSKATVTKTKNKDLILTATITLDHSQAFLGDVLSCMCILLSYWKLNCKRTVFTAKIGNEIIPRNLPTDVGTLCRDKATTI